MMAAYLNRVVFRQQSDLCAARRRHRGMHCGLQTSAGFW